MQLQSLPEGQSGWPHQRPLSGGLCRCKESWEVLPVTCISRIHLLLPLAVISIDAQRNSEPMLETSLRFNACSLVLAPWRGCLSFLVALWSFSSSFHRSLDRRSVDHLATSLDNLLARTTLRDWRSNRKHSDLLQRYVWQRNAHRTTQHGTWIISICNLSTQCQN